MNLSKSAKLFKNLFKKSIKKVATRQGYGEGLLELGKTDKRVMVLCCDLTESTKSNLFAEAFPDRFVEIGVAEQNMAGVAAGLALEGKIPFISSYAVFSPGRNWDQIRISVCYSQANVKIAGAHAGISVGPDGATHQALEDIAITRVLPNMTVVVPADYLETKKATTAAAILKGPVYLRFTRNATPAFTTKSSPFKIGQAEILNIGSDVSIIACGPLVYEALLAARILARNKIIAEVINCHTVKPLDINTILKSVAKTKAVVTVEEHQITGGLGGAVSELLSEMLPTRQIRIGVKDKFGESGRPQELLDAFGLTHPAIIQAVKKIIKSRRDRGSSTKSGKK